MLYASFTVVLSALLVTYGSGAAVQETTNFPELSAEVTCRRDDSEYSSCITDALQNSWPSIVQGLDKLGMPRLDPLEIESIEQDLHTGEFAGYVTLKDVKVYGLAKVKFLSVRPQFSGDRIKLNADVLIPKVFIECDYDADGSIGSAIKLGGKGHFNITMTRLKAACSLVGRVENDIWVVEHFRVDPQIEGMKVYFSNLLNGNEDLNSAAVLIANQYWPVFFQGMKPIISTLTDPRLTYFVNHYVFSKIPVSQLFP